ncbi:MAG TPA: helicase-related protein [Candidatus Omnitrophota bacterium]|nr:helicase-related protein [Candidatus Omnitrophota bacterium]
MELHQIKVGQKLKPEELEFKLTELKYQAVPAVSAPGHFSIRGAAIDIFPVSYRLPVRVRVAGDAIANIRDFTLSDGRNMTEFDEVFLMPVSDLFQRKLEKLEEQFALFEPVFKAKDLERGDYVVHPNYGVGKFLGLKTLTDSGKKEKHLAIEYADREILYVSTREPVERFIGGSYSRPKLTKLHSKDWERVQQKTKNALHRVASDMLEIQVKRNIEKGFEFKPQPEWETKFSEGFAFELTEGQKRSLKEVYADMEGLRPMDRLLCGDVGYGKTEVAIRAAFRAALNGKQVAFLVPTTLLAEQHYLRLKERLMQFPVRLQLLSRFQTKDEGRRIAEGLRLGEIDIVVGTHRLLSKDIEFKDLGLVIIDEEQRFGVTHKERLKSMRALVDILTLTATPIPRTLHLSMLGVRDMSVIDTPPKTRLPVETYVTPYNEGLIAQSVRKELERNGQIYFIHNRVQDMEKVYLKLKRLLPSVRLGVAHGQMSAGELEKVMKDFMEHRLDCLIATNIVESGIDIPNVNTLIVDRADMFGLADLYQLRGRVGRYHQERQAYAYLLIPPQASMGEEASKRLKAIERFTDLGSGFKIAVEDLQIRGAGNLLGHEQSGFIHAVGFDMYCRMLKQAIEDQMNNQNTGAVRRT